MIIENGGSDQDEHNEDFISFKANQINGHSLPPESSDNPFPWLSKDTAKIRDPMLRLHNEIIEFTDFILPSQRHHQLRTESTTIQCDIKTFGSYSTMLYLPQSDIDLVLIKKNNDADINLFDQIHQILLDSNLYEQFQPLKHAKVPILKFVERKTKFNFDLTINNIDGIFQVDEVKKALKVYPEIRYLLIVLKYTLKIRELDDTYKGGIGSFLLFCMLLTFLRQTRRQYLKEKKLDKLQEVCLGEYLIEFLNFYSIKHDWSREKIIMKDGGKIEEKQSIDNAFSLISPSDERLDIGNSAYKIRDAFNMMKNRYQLLVNYNFKIGDSILKLLVNPQEEEFNI